MKKTRTARCWEVRVALKLTQPEMAKKMNCCIRSIKYWEATDRALIPVFQKRLERLDRTLNRRTVSSG